MERSGILGGHGVWTRAGFSRRQGFPESSGKRTQPMSVTCRTLLLVMLVAIAFQFAAAQVSQQVTITEDPNRLSSLRDYSPSSNNPQHSAALRAGLS